MQMFHCAPGGSEITVPDNGREVLKGTAPFLLPKRLWITEACPY